MFWPYRHSLPTNHLKGVDCVDHIEDIYNDDHVENGDNGDHIENGNNGDYLETVKLVDCIGYFDHIDHILLLALLTM